MDNFFSSISLQDAGTALLDLAMPRRCIACRRPLTLRERFLCLPCLADFPYTHYWELPHNPMADRFNALIQQDLDSSPDHSGTNPPFLCPFASSPDHSGTDSPVLCSFGQSPADSGTNSSILCSFESSLADSSTNSPVLCLNCEPQASSSGTPFRGHEPYAFAAALFFYSSASDYRHIPWHLKYEGGLAAGRHFARMLGERLAASSQFADVDVVVPVPLHWTRQWRRGYNQAEVIARELGAALGAELRADILRRVRRTRSQVHLSVPEKAANVRGAFALRRSFALRHPSTIRRSLASQCPSNCHRPATLRRHSIVRRLSAISRSFLRSKLSHSLMSRLCLRNLPVFSQLSLIDSVSERSTSQVRHILLVDDTFTTGSTLNACRGVLRQAFPLPTRISVATLAFVAPD